MSRSGRFLLKVLRNLLADDEDMMSLSLTNQNEKEDIELLLSSVAADLDEIETEIKIFIDMRQCPTKSTPSPRLCVREVSLAPF